MFDVVIACIGGDDGNGDNGDEQWCMVATVHVMVYVYYTSIYHHLGKVWGRV